MNAGLGIQGETGGACQPSICRWISTSWPITARWIYLLTILLWSTDAIATGTLFDVYINDLARRQGYRNPNEFIGVMESSRGITCLIVALPLGYLFDKFDRLRVLRYAVLCFGLSGGFLLSIRSSVKIYASTFFVRAFESLWLSYKMLGDGRAIRNSDVRTSTLLHAVHTRHHRRVYPSSKA